jgi:hypothetical protein
MKNVRWLIFLITGFLCSGFYKEKTWVINPDSKLAIHGSTNVNTFTCRIQSYCGYDTLRYSTNHATCKIEFTTNRMTIPITSFDCGSGQISKDFHKTLKSDTYPELDINFISLDNTSLTKNSIVRGVIDITLAGITTRYYIKFGVTLKNGTLLLGGYHPVNFADFRLKAPEKLKGLIRVREVLNVEFNLVLNAI